MVKSEIEYADNREILYDGLVSISAFVRKVVRDVHQCASAERKSIEEREVVVRCVSFVSER